MKLDVLPPGVQRSRLRFSVLSMLFGLVFCVGPTAGLAEPVVVSTQLCNGLWIVPLTWQGESGERHELTAVFDTGGSGLLIDPDTLERLSGQRVPEGRRVRMRNVSASGIEFSTFRPRVREMSHLGAALGLEFDVFLPYPAFDGKLLVLDYPAMEMRVEEGTLSEPDGEHIFSAAGPDDRPWLRVEFPDRARRVLIDSGSNGRIELKQSYGMQWSSEPVVAAVATRMDKVVMRRAGRVADTVTVANLDFEQPIVSLTRDTELMGVEVLRHFVLTFDIANERVRFEHDREGTVRMPPELGTGALLRADAEGYLEVVHRLHDSPAERAGLQDGDRIVELDGVAVAERGCRSLEASEPGRVSYGLEREGRIERIELERVPIIE